MTEPAAARDPNAAARLADALMKVSVLDTVDARRLCVLDAMERLRLRLSVAEFDDKKMHIVTMVRAFGSVAAGWQRLTEAVQHLADYDLPSRHAASLAHPVVPPVLDDRTQEQLKALLEGLDRTNVPELPAVYHAAAGAHFGPLPDFVHTAWDAHQLLAHTNRPTDGAPRTVRFLQGLAMVLTPERGDAVRSWVSHQVRAGARGHLEAQRILDDSRESAGGSAEKSVRPAYLLIRLAPSTTSPDRVDISCWASSGATWEPRRREQCSVPASTVRRHVATLIDREESRLRTHRGSLVLEFILPLSMMNEPVEEWSRHAAFGQHSVWDSELGGPPIGTDYKVVVRSKERIDALQLHRVWNERWDVLSTDEQQAGTHHCAAGDGARAESLYEYLRRTPDIVLMILGSPPDDDNGRKELLAGLQAGLPLLLWRRRGASAGHPVTLAEGLLEGDLHEVLDRLTCLRSAPHPGDHDAGGSGPRLAVLWDDPNRLPEVPEPIA
ncbi:hypothetical protein [Streptomyces sp. LUP47B]|uniref:VMAP-C domain-containing protein n=1 Tax=Streptomyces sp. LUP47B TaxID=1890286 RepID=UPI000851CBBB|nr:hypothetical protein [Streptomyces sp. LUP47B]